MAYKSSYQLHPSRKGKTGPFSSWLIIGGFLLLFFVAVFWFRATGNKKGETQNVNSTADILTPRSVASSVIEGGIDVNSAVASLIGLNSKQVVGQATRGTKNGTYFFEAKATLLPIDREKQFYDVWLVRLIPYDFISLGEMTTDDLGNFVMSWQPGDDRDLQSYSKIVVTLQNKGGDPDPQTHIVEGEFGK